MPSLLQAPKRKDAQRNREAILTAARALFAESGDVPMYEVARRAGVGQGTLYRNFQDRGALVAELLEEEVQHLEALAVEHAGDPEAFFLIVAYVVEIVGRFEGISEVAREAGCVGAELERARVRLAELIEGPLRGAQAAGVLRRDLTAEDVFLVVRMVKGAVAGAEGAGTRAANAGRALSLVLDGLGPAPERRRARPRSSRRAKLARAG
jgi:AcrR family transcriptional regulator